MLGAESDPYLDLLTDFLKGFLKGWKLMGFWKEMMDSTTVPKSLVLL